MSICAVSVAVHVCDCENIGDEEKAALLQFFHAPWAAASDKGGTLLLFA
jgi:hypothetical protein